MSDRDGWHHIDDGIPEKGEDYLILFLDGNRKTKRIFYHGDEPRWGKVAGGIPLTRAPWWRELPARPTGFVARRNPSMKQIAAARELPAVTVKVIRGKDVA